MENEIEKYSEDQVQAFNDMAGYLSFMPNFISWALGQCRARIIFIVTGNQFGKTANISYDYIRRIFGTHPIKEKNITPDVSIRTLRFCANALPLETSDEGEVKNTIYPQFKKFLPPSLIEKEVSQRKPTLVIKSPLGGRNVVIEFVSYGQEVQSQAGFQRLSCFMDEESPKSFYEEQLPRLLAANGDLIIGLTPANEITWTYETLYQRAGTIYNSPTIIKYLKKKEGLTHPMIEKNVSGDPRIAVIRAATDDNPTYKYLVDKINKEFGTKMTVDEYIKDILVGIDDPTTMEIRRYGIFHQIAGSIFKSLVTTPGEGQVISAEKYFPRGIPEEWVHARGIDYHPHTNWACGWIALSDHNEAFIYQEDNPSPDFNTTYAMVEGVVYKSKDFKYAINLIDPTADIKQPNTGLTPLNDINRYFNEFKRNGVGTGGYWQTWDTKNQRGRDIIKERLNNSRVCGRPFNNRVVKNGVESFLPTLWIMDSCPITIYMFKNWKWESYVTREAQVTKEDKNKPEDKNSHFPVLYECVFKHPLFSTGKFRPRVTRESPYERMFNRGAI